MKKTILPILGLAIILAGLLIGLNLAGQRQEIRKRAAVTGGVGKASLDPTTASKYPGQVFPVAIKFRTGTTDANALVMSTLSLRITYSYSGTTPELDVVDATGSPVDTLAAFLSPTLTGSGDWFFPVKSVTRASGKVTIDIAAANANIAGFKSATEVVLATIYLKANRPPTTNPIVLAFDLAQSKMMTKTDPPTDFLDNPASVSYSIQGDTTPPTTISNLTISNPTKQSLTLNWSAPSDTGPEGKAAAYNLRYSTATISDANWASATQVAGLSIPTTPGTAQSIVVANLATGTTYYFGLKSTDASGNISALSNIPSSSTSPATLAFGFRLQGIGAANLTRPFEVMLKGTVTKTYTGVNFKSDASGVFIPVSPLILTDFPISGSGISVDVLVKDSNHLRKKLGNLILNSTDNLGPSAWNSLVVRAGDFDNNNVLNISDVSNLISNYNSLSVPTTTTNIVYDVNADNFITIDDVSIVLTNYIALTISGD